MVRIQVVQKSTGKTGSMPEENFNPTLYDMVPSNNSGGLPSQPPINPVAPQEGLATKLDRFLMPATTNLAQDLGASWFTGTPEYKAAEQSGKDVQQQLYDLAVRAKNATDPKVKEKLLEVVRKGMAQHQQTGGMPDAGFSKDINRSYLERSLAVGSELGTLLAPINAGVNPQTGEKLLNAGGRILSAAEQGGIAAAARRGTQLSDESLKERAIGTGIAGTIGALVSGTFQAGGELFNKLGQGGKNLGQELRQNVVNPQVKNTDVRGSQHMKEIQQGMEGLGFKGGSKTQYEQLPEVADKLDLQLKQALQNNNGSIAVKKANSILDDSLLGGTTGYSESAKGDYQGWLDHFKGIVSGDIKKGDIPVSDLFKAKMDIASQIPQAFGKDSGVIQTAMTPKEDVGLAVWRALDDLITTADPGLKQITTNFSMLHRAVPGLAMAAKSNGSKALEVLGTKIPIPGEILSGAQDLAGRGLEKTGSLTSAISNKLGDKFGPTLLKEGALLPGMIMNDQNRLPQTPPDLTGGQVDTTGTQLPMTPPNQDQVLGAKTGGLPPSPSVSPAVNQKFSQGWFDQAAQQDIMATGGKNLSQIKAARDYFYPNKPVKKSSGQIAADMVLSNIKSLKSDIGLVDERGRNTGQVSQTKILMDKLSPGGSSIETSMDLAIQNLITALPTKGTGGASAIYNHYKKLYGITPFMSDSIIKQRINAFEKIANEVIDQSAGVIPGSVDTSLPYNPPESP